MFQFLKYPFPCIMGQKQNFIAALLIGIFVALFLILFEPFGISDPGETQVEIKAIGFGLVTFLVLLLFYFVAPKIFSGYFEEKNYTVQKDIVADGLMLLFLGIANGIYSRYALSTEALATTSIFVMIGQTFLVGIFPISFLTLLQYNRLLKSNTLASNNIHLPGVKTAKQLEAKQDQFYLISDDQEKTKIALDNLLYLESDGNYANLNQIKDGKHTKTIHRVTLKSIESENNYQNIIRCHRSFIVNLDQVVKVKGNAQGLKLNLKNCDDLVPVSRKYISLVKGYFNS